MVQYTSAKVNFILFNYYRIYPIFNKTFMKYPNTLFISKMLLCIGLVMLFSCNTSSERSDLDSVAIDTEQTADSKELKISEYPSLKHQTIKAIFIHGIHPDIFTELAESRTSVDEELDITSNPDKNGTVYLLDKQFTGNSVPFVCYVTGNIKALYVDGKKIKFKKDKEFFFRQHIDLYIGYNRVPIKIVNSRDEVAKLFIEINIVEH